MELGVLVFVGSFFPATLFGLTAIVTSTLYFFVDHNCNSKIDTLYYVGIALGHAFALVHGVSLTVPTSLKWPIIGFSIHAFASAAYIVVAVLIYLYDDVSDVCLTTTYARTLMAIVGLFIAYVIVFAVTALSVVWSVCCSNSRVSKYSDKLAHTHVTSRPSATGRSHPHNLPSASPPTVELANLTSKATSLSQGLRRASQDVDVDNPSAVLERVRWQADAKLPQTNNEDVSLLSSQDQESSASMAPAQAERDVEGVVEILKTGPP